jgi:CheY-like chemotaxis protein
MAKVLVVDDNEQVRQLLMLLLEDAGHEVTTCADGSHVLGASKAESPDIVLMDLNMPEVDGFTALRLLRDDASLRHIPVIMVTASGHQELMGKARELGATDFIVKPWKDYEVEDRIELALSSSGGAARD